MKVVSTEIMRELDRRTIEEAGIPGETLMERAGHGVAVVAYDTAMASGCVAPQALVCAGRGNNGGDGFVAALYLQQWGLDVQVLLAGEEKAVKGDALIHLKRMRAEGVPLIELATVEAWNALGGDEFSGVNVVVDSLLGTGISGAAQGTSAAAIDLINRLGSHIPVIAVDVPSGLSSDTGEAEGVAVQADVTVTMGLPKAGLLNPAALEFVGNLEVIDIGVPSAFVADIESDVELITVADLQHLLPRRNRASHKGTYGHVLISGGAAGYAGAVAMAARAAIRSGTGLVSLLVPEYIAGTVAAMVPEAMVHAAEETSLHSLSSDCVEAWGRDIDEFDAILIGPGMTTHEQSAALVRKILAQSKIPVVLDADALNVCAGEIDVIRDAACPVIITPHPGEMARLLGCRTADVQADRLAAARKAVADSGAVVVLKGAGTIIAAKGRPPGVNLSGNPGMATGGTGDVLSGLIAGLVAQKVDIFDAARLGVYVHGRAGDMGALRRSQAGLVASDLIDEIPDVFREIFGR